jgi:glyoxylate/hydroxypyruvate reductase A
LYKLTIDLTEARMADDLRVLICSYLEEELVARVAAVPGVEVVNGPELLPVPAYPCDHNGLPHSLDEEQRRRWSSLLQMADVCFDFDWEDPARMPERAPSVRWVQATSAGIGGFMERTGLADWKIVVTTAAGVHAAPLTEWVLTGILYFVKDIPDVLARQSAHRWQRLAMDALAGRRALVIGVGNVGRAAASALKALGVEVWGIDRSNAGYVLPQFAGIASAAEMGELLLRCDILVLTCPLTAETRGLVGAAELAALGPDGILVNVARGPVVDEPALIEALQQHRLRGAVLDVVAEEPLSPASPLWDLDNVLLTPHSASTMTDENTALVELFLDNLEHFRNGTPLRNVYDSSRGF